MTCLGLLFILWCPSSQPVVVDTYCDKTKYIYWHRDDTRRTKEQADVHNRIRKESKCK